MDRGSNRTDTQDLPHSSRIDESRPPKELVPRFHLRPPRPLIPRLPHLTHRRTRVSTCRPRSSWVTHVPGKRWTFDLRVSLVLRRVPVGRLWVSLVRLSLRQTAGGSHEVVPHPRDFGCRRGVGGGGGPDSARPSGGRRRPPTPTLSQRPRDTRRLGLGSRRGSSRLPTDTTDHLHAESLWARGGTRRGGDVARHPRALQMQFPSLWTRDVGSAVPAERRRTGLQRSEPRD